MNRTEKAGWIALGLTFLGVSIAVTAFIWTGPAAIQRSIRHVMRPEIYEAVLPKAIDLFDSLPDQTTILPDDARGAALAKALFPSTYSFISKQNDNLLIECGGGFQHYGFKLEKNSSGGFTFYLQIEDQKDRILKTTEPNKAVEPTSMAVTFRAPSSTKCASHARGSL